VSEKEQYQRELQAQLDAWTKDVETFKLLSAKVSEQARVAMMLNIVTLEEKIAEGNAKLAEVSNASEEAWASMKDGVESAWATLKEAYRDATSKFKG